jgi:hypothetical protein
MRHLFLAPLGASFGEALVGVRLARELIDGGDEVLFLAPDGLAGLVEGAGLIHGRIDRAMPRLAAEALRLVAERRCDTLVLVDAAAVAKAFAALRLDLGALADAPVVALDLWNLPETGLVWDYGPHEERLDPRILAFGRRLVPVPLARPDVPGGYDALPRIAPLSADARARLRAELGVSAKLVLWPSAGWQHAAAHRDPALRRLADELPPRVLRALAPLGVAVVHVGPEPFAGAGAFPGYRHLPQLAPQGFARLLSAADLYLGFNAAATSLAGAIAARAPILLGQPAGMRAWPLSLDRFLAPFVDGNPCYGAARVADPLDEAAFAGAARELLFDAAAADALRARQAEIEARVRALPGGRERLVDVLAR